MTPSKKLWIVTGILFTGLLLALPFHGKGTLKVQVSSKDVQKNDDPGQAKGPIETTSDPFAERVVIRSLGDTQSRPEQPVSELPLSERPVNRQSVNDLVATESPADPRRTPVSSELSDLSRRRPTLPSLPDRYQPLIEKVAQVPELRSPPVDALQVQHAAGAQEAETVSGQFQEPRRLQEATYFAGERGRTLPSAQSETEGSAEDHATSSRGDLPRAALGPAVIANRSAVPQASSETTSARRWNQRQVEVAAQSYRSYRIRDGDTLASLADRFLGDSRLAGEIFKANQDRLRHPELLPLGIEIRIPTR